MVRRRVTTPHLQGEKRPYVVRNRIDHAIATLWAENIWDAAAWAYALYGSGTRVEVKAQDEIGWAHAYAKEERANHDERMHLIWLKLVKTFWP